MRAKTISITEAITFMQLSTTALPITGEQIKKQYRTLSFEYHPDVCDKPDATQLFQKLTLCFEVLSKAAPINTLTTRPIGNDWSDLFNNYKRQQYYNQNNAKFDRDSYDYARGNQDNSQNFYGKPPKYDSYDWRQSQNGNYYFNQGDICHIVYLCKSGKHKGEYASMRIDKQTDAKYFENVYFKSFEDGMRYVEKAYLQK